MRHLRVFLLLGLCQAALPAAWPGTQDELTLRCGDIDVMVLPDRACTISRIFRAGRPICDGAAVGQGTVVGIDPAQGIYAGSVHGLETLLEVRLTVDGRPADPRKGAFCEGLTVTLHRRTLLADLFILNSVLTLTPGRIEETVELQGINPDKTGAPVYGFLASRDNRLVQYAAFDAAGRLEKAGATAGDQDEITVFGRAVAVAQYDPNQTDGVLSAVTRGTEHDLVHFIWDRPFDNKLYARFQAAETWAGIDRCYRLKQVLLFFDAQPANWIQTVEQLLKCLPDRPLPADLNGDCTVDLHDLNAFAAYWLAG